MHGEREQQIAAEPDEGLLAYRDEPGVAGQQVPELGQRQHGEHEDQIVEQIAAGEGRQRYQHRDEAGAGKPDRARMRGGDLDAIPHFRHPLLGPQARRQRLGLRRHETPSHAAGPRCNHCAPSLGTAKCASTGGMQEDADGLRGLAPLSASRLAARADCPCQASSRKRAAPAMRAAFARPRSDALATACCERNQASRAPFSDPATSLRVSSAAQPDTNRSRRLWICRPRSSRGLMGRPAGNSPRGRSTSTARNARGPARICHSGSMKRAHVPK